MRQQVLKLLIAISMMINTANAVDLGKYGTTFEVKEEGFVAMMMRKLKEVDLTSEQQKMEQAARERVANPVPVKNIVRATVTREFYYDPSYITKKDITLPCGKVLYPAGTRVNPLEHMELERRLLFVDARNKGQVEWLKERLQQDQVKSDKVAGSGKNTEFQTLIILVGGSVFTLEEELGQKVYFDQSGEITTKFGIKASPAIAEQEGKIIKIKEINLKGE